MEERSERSLTELRSEAKAVGVRGYSRLSREELLHELEVIDDPARLAESAGPAVDPAASPARVDGRGGADANLAAPAHHAAHHEGRYATSGAHAELERYSPDAPGALPTSYGEDRLVLMARDPQWLFAYWEIRSETAQRAMREIEESVPVLRVSYRPSEGRLEGRSYDERIDLFARRHYLHVPEAHHVYRAELGFRSRDGRFVAALRSNEVFAPPDGVSLESEEQFATVTWDTPLEGAMRPARFGTPPGSAPAGERAVPGLAGAPAGSSGLSQRGADAAEGRPTSGDWPTSPGGRRSS
jgi:hypothetical protein